MFNFKKDAAGIDGWLTEAEGLFLYTTAKTIESEKAIVEIGSWKGKSTICLGNGVKEGNKSKIYAIDPHIGSSDHKLRREGDTFEIFKQNIEIAGLNEYIQAIKKSSEEAAKNFKEQIGFIFIDGGHEYKFASLDFKLWFPKIADGGVIAFHDSWHRAGPSLVTTFVLLTSSRIQGVKLIDRITYFKKVQKNSLIERIQNICFLIYRPILAIGIVMKFIKLKRAKGSWQ
ncbi:class I SAM-dependent methyltransferase [Candidatus Jorgensenbacteria bacterium]|nr:class I SAM-dependent methyltransferase [Candidatus Jorgensenbacteria bacterium]